MAPHPLEYAQARRKPPPPHRHDNRLDIAYVVLSISCYITLVVSLKIRPGAYGHGTYDEIRDGILADGLVAYSFLCSLALLLFGLRETVVLGFNRCAALTLVGIVLSGLLLTLLSLRQL